MQPRLWTKRQFSHMEGQTQIDAGLDSGLKCCRYGMIMPALSYSSTACRQRQNIRRSDATKRFEDASKYLVNIRLYNLWGLTHDGQVFAVWHAVTHSLTRPKVVSGTDGEKDGYLWARWTTGMCLSPGHTWPSANPLTGHALFGILLNDPGRCYQPCN